MELYTKKRCIGDDRTVGIRRANHPKSTPPHHHEFIEIVYILSGESEQTVDDACYSVSRGDVIFINPGSTHAFTVGKDFTFTEIFFSPTLVEEGAITAKGALALLSLSAFNEMRGEQNGGKLSFRGEERQEFEAILFAMEKEYAKNLPDTPAIMESYLNILLTKMRRVAMAAGGGEIIEDIWQGLKDYIDTHPEEDLTLSALASRGFYNPSYFSRTFKKRFGMPPMEYVRRQRMERAKEYLLESDASVEEILRRVGYSDRSAFYHAFSAETGMTPTEFRQAHGKR